ncbi:MAG: hypothetical protein ACOYIF_10435 [Acetivibrionales bacterium]|jgi:hypothetical protein
MKKLTTKIISLILTLSMLFGLSVPASAAQSYNAIGVKIIGSNEEIEAAREAYFSLTPEAKAIFDASLANDPEMLEFHIKYVDKSFRPATKIQARYAMASSDAMTILMSELSVLGLPSSVLYALKAMGAGLVASIADGPLLVGEILLAAATASAVIVIAANWTKVSPVWNQIVAAFKKAFSSSVNSIIDAFNSLKKDIQKEAASSAPSVTVSGKTITVNGVKYNCNTRASELTEQQRKKSRYYPVIYILGRSMLM